MTMHPQFQTEQIGTSDPDPEPSRHYEVHCGKCKWWGYESQLRKIYSPIPLGVGAVEPELCCPLCCEAGWLEYKEDDTPIPCSILYKAVLLATEKLESFIEAQVAVGRALERECQRKSQLKK